MRAKILLSIVLLTIAAEAQIKFACVGNSITAGFAAPAGKSYPDQLQGLLGSNYAISNEGVSMSTMSKNSNVPYWGTSAFLNVLGLNPNIITIKLGTNDANSGNWPNCKSEYEADYNAMIDVFQAISSKPQIWLVLCTPSYASSYQEGILDSNVIPIIKRIAEQRHLPIIDCHTPLLNHPELFSDGIHPTADGADTIAHIFYRALHDKAIVDLSDSLVTVDYTIGQPRTTQTFQNIARNLFPKVTHIAGPLTVTSKSSWLSLSVNATNPDSQIINGTINASSLPDVEQKYYDTVTVQAGSWLALDLSFRVLVWIHHAQVLTSLSIAPADSGVIPSSKPFQFTATALDQYNMPMMPQPGIAWLAAGGTLSQSGLFTPLTSTTAGLVSASIQGNASIHDSTRVSILNCTRGIAYDYYSNFNGSSLSDITGLTSAKSGTMANFSSQSATASSNYAYHYHGRILLLATGTYSFFTSSDDGSSLSIDGVKLVDNDGIHPVQEKMGTATLGWGLHTIDVLYFQGGGGAGLFVSWQGPGIVNAAIPDSVLFHDAGPTSTVRDDRTATNDRFSREPIAIISVGRSIAVQVPSAATWELELFSLDGSMTKRIAGRDATLVSLADIVGCSMLARLRCGRNVTISRLFNR